MLHTFGVQVGIYGLRVGFRVRRVKDLTRCRQCFNKRSTCEVGRASTAHEQ